MKRLCSENDLSFKKREIKKIKNYLLGEVIGEGKYEKLLLLLYFLFIVGSFGKVKEAYDTLYQRHCAIKIIKKKQIKYVFLEIFIFFLEINFF